MKAVYKAWYAARALRHGHSTSRQRQRASATAAAAAAAAITAAAAELEAATAARSERVMQLKDTCRLAADELERVKNSGRTQTELRDALIQRLSATDKAAKATDRRIARTKAMLAGDERLTGEARQAVASARAALDDAVRLLELEQSSLTAAEGILEVCRRAAMHACAAAGTRGAAVERASSLSRAWQELQAQRDEVNGAAVKVQLLAEKTETATRTRRELEVRSFAPRRRASKRASHTTP